MRSNMRTLFRLSLLASLATAVPGCFPGPGNPIHTVQTENPEFEVGLLFTHEGCRVYRFRDQYRYVYYADCGSSASTEHEESCGRGCVTSEVVTTSGH